MLAQEHSLGASHSYARTLRNALAQESTSNAWGHEVSIQGKSPPTKAFTFRGLVSLRIRVILRAS